MDGYSPNYGNRFWMVLTHPHINQSSIKTINPSIINQSSIKTINQSIIINQFLDHPEWTAMPQISPDPAALSRDAVRCFISFWIWVSRRPSSETVLAIWAKDSSGIRSRTDYPAWWTYKKQWKMAIEIVDVPSKNGDFPWQNVSSPEGNMMGLMGLTGDFMGDLWWLYEGFYGDLMGI